MYRASRIYGIIKGIPPGGWYAYRAKKGGGRNAAAWFHIYRSYFKPTSL
jgi:hypothetical protein